MSTKAGDAPRRRLTPEVRRDEIVRVGARLFGANAYNSVRMEAVAEAAGVSRALMYRYFPDKRALFVAVVTSLSDEMLARTAESIDPDAGAFAQLRTGVLGYLEQYEKHPHAAEAIVLGVGSTDPQLIRRDRHDSERLSELVVGRVCAMLDIDRSDEAVQLLPSVTRAWLAFTNEMIRQWLIDPNLGRDEVADHCAHALLDVCGRIPGLPDHALTLLTDRS